MLYLSLSGQINSYLQSAFRPWVGICGVVLLTVSAVLVLTNIPVRDSQETLKTLQTTAQSTQTAHSPGHSHGSGWVSGLILVPVFLVVCCAPGALGSSLISSTALAGGGIDLSKTSFNQKDHGKELGLFAGQKITPDQADTEFKRELAAKTQRGWEEAPGAAQAQSQPQPQARPAIPEPLPTVGADGSDPIMEIGPDGSYQFQPLKDKNNQITLEELANRWTFGQKKDLAGKTLTLQGFAIALPNADKHWMLGRFKIFCCAADAIPYLAVINQSKLGGKEPPADTWLQVTAQVDTQINTEFPTLIPTEIKPISEPSNPYL